MTSDQFVLFCLQIAAMLACGLVCGQLLQRLHQPAVLGEMLGGLVLGPTMLGFWFPSLHGSLFPPDPQLDLLRNGSIRLGMLFFLFSVGLEIDLGGVWRQGRRALAIGGLGTLIPMACGAAAVIATPGLWGPQADDQPFAFALFIGACLANSANPVMARILMDLGLLGGRVGTLLMAATIVDDLVSWSTLPLIFSRFAPPQASAIEVSTGQNLLFLAAALAGLVTVGRWVVMPALRWVRHHAPWPSAFLAVVSVVVLLSAALAEYLGIHAFLGPFLLGLALQPSDEERREAYDVLTNFSMCFFVPIYFVSMGLTSDFVHHFDVRLVALVLVVAFASKIVAVYWAAALCGIRGRTALGLGFGMNARGAVGIILAALGKENGVIDERVFVTLVLMAIVTSLAAGPAMRRLLDAGALADEPA